MGLKLNRVTLAPDTSSLPPGASLLPQHQRKSYDVDDKDFFWEAAGALPFPKVGAAAPCVDLPAAQGGHGRLGDRGGGLTIRATALPEDGSR